MPRSGPSEADRELIATLAHEGISVSPNQLERWRTAGAIPRNRRRGLGRGRGSSSETNPETLAAVRTLAAGAKKGSPNPWSDPLVRFATGKDVGEGEVRTSLLNELQRWIDRLAADGRDGESAEDARFEAAERAAQRVRGLPDLEALGARA